MSAGQYNLPDLQGISNVISARYFLARSDAIREKIDYFVESIGYGVGQTTDQIGLSIFPCSEMLSKPRKVVNILNKGILDDEWIYIDVGVQLKNSNFSVLGFAGLLSYFAGDIFGAPYTKTGLVLEKLVLPKELISFFPGPKYGDEDVLLKANGQAGKRHILGLLLKPNNGVPPNYYADIVEAAVQGGIEYIKEDELTMDSKECPRFKRISMISKRLSKSGKNILYAANITAPSHHLFKTALRAVEAGASAILVNGLYVGFDAVSFLASNSKIKVPIHWHRAGYDILSSGVKAISVPCLTELFRLAGADIVHVGSPLGGVFSKDVVWENCRRLEIPINNVKRSIPVFSRSSIDTIAVIRNNSNIRGSIILFDAYIYNSPLGIEKAAKNINDRLKDGDV